MVAIYNAQIDNSHVRVCKRVATGTRVKKTVCLTQSQWDKVHRASLEYLADNESDVLTR